MNNWTIDFAPLMPWTVIVVLAAIAGVFVLYGLIKGMRGSVLRLLAWACLALALANPSVLNEDRDPLKTVVAVVVDESDSQKLDGRDVQTQQTREAIAELLAKFPQYDVREVVARNGGAASGDASTALFSSLQSAFQNVPPDQVGGAILITDGQVHDIPKVTDALGFDAPIHAQAKRVTVIDVSPSKKRLVLALSARARKSFTRLQTQIFPIQTNPLKCGCLSTGS
jgi:hypothetical protein